MGREHWMLHIVLALVISILLTGAIAASLSTADDTAGSAELKTD